MNESKMTYIAFALSVGAIAVGAVTAGLSALPNTSKIDALSAEVVKLREQNETFQSQLRAASENRTRINELDIGLTAMATVMNIDRNELAKAITAAKAQEASVAQAPAQGVAVTAGIQKPVEVLAPAVQLPAQQALPSNDSREKLASQVAGAGAGAGAVQPGEQTAQLAADTESDNPFAAALDGAGGTSSDTPPPLAIASAPAQPLTIEQVDSVLAKRISEKWYKPSGAAADLYAIIQIKMTRDGKVASVNLTKPSGSDAFDTSVISAVKSIVAIDEVQRLSDDDFQKAYANRSIQFTPQMGG